ncbi:MAG: flagellar hook-associated protein FlgK, partial [Mesorhizobium sp.]
MSLSTALNIAQSALQSNARQTATVSRNITSASDPDYNRRAASLSSQVPGIRVMSIQRATDAALFRSNLSATASYEGQYTLRAAIESMTQGINGIEHGSSPAKAIGSLYESLQFYASNPANASVAESAIDAAREVVRTLNNGTASVNAARAEADRNIAQSISDLNQLLADFKKTNDAIVGGTAMGRDVNDALDKRDGLLKQIAALVPVSTITRDNNDIVITTASGAILFETVPREVTFQPTLVYGPNTAGNAVMIDGVPLVPGSGANTDASGRIAANLQMRDDIAPKMQAQLDEIARGLISTFAETDQTGGGAPSLAGLFTWSGGPALPPGGMTTTGLAASISINAAMDSTAGGNAFA